MNPSKIQRRVMLVDRRFQLKYLALFGLLGATAAVGGALAVWAAGVHGGVDTFFVVLLSVLALTGALAIGGACLVLTYRVAGPVFVMSHVLWTLAEGKLPSLRTLRADDELCDLYELLKRSIELLRARELEEVARLQQALSVLSTSESKQNSEAIRLVEALCEKKSSLATSMPAFDAGSIKN